MPNNSDSILILVNLYVQQFIIVIANILPTIDALAFANPMGEFFQVIEMEFRAKVLKKFYNLPPFFDKKMKPSKCSIGSFSSLKRILKASQAWKMPIDIFIR
jgi:hypothetical protein